MHIDIVLLSKFACVFPLQTRIHPKLKKLQHVSGFYLSFFCFSDKVFVEDRILRTETDNYIFTEAYFPLALNTRGSRMSYIANRSKTGHVGVGGANGEQDSTQAVGTAACKQPTVEIEELE